MEVFKNQEPEYAAWQAAHPHGFVLNHFGGTNPSYNVLHRSNCVFLWRGSDKGTRTVVEKWCADSEMELSDQANALLGRGIWKRCGVCFRSQPVTAPPPQSSPISQPQPIFKQAITEEIWIEGEPAVSGGSGEKAWKERSVSKLTTMIRQEEPQWLDIQFRLPSHKLYSKDIDNLITPVLESARDAGWIERGFAFLGSVTAKKVAVVDPAKSGALIIARHSPPSLVTNRAGILIEIPLISLNDETVKWALYERSLELFAQRPELRFPPQFPMLMEIRVTVSDAGRRKSLQALMKPCIDGMEPLLGHPDNLLPEPRERLNRSLAPQDEMVIALAFHVRGGEADEVAVLLAPYASEEEA